MGLFAEFSLWNHIDSSYTKKLIFLVSSSVLIILFGTILIFTDVFAQSETVSVDIQPMMGQVNVASLPKPEKLSQSFEMPYLTEDPASYSEAKSQVKDILTAESFALSTQSPSSVIVAPEVTGALAIFSGFDGINQAIGGFVPPDVQVATGPNHVVEFVNSAGQIWTKSGTPLSAFSLTPFFFNPPDFPVDPKIFYDSISGKWFASALIRNTNNVRIAISLTNDPTGNWFVYNISYDTCILPDQPKIGASNDKFVITTNDFDDFCPASTGAFVGGHIKIINKNLLITGSTITIQDEGASFSDTSVAPAKNLSSSSTLFLVRVINNDNVVRFYSIDGSVPSAVITTVDRTILTAFIPPDGVQPGTAFLINTGDSRVQDAAWFQGKLWLALNDRCLLSGDVSFRSCIHLIQIDTTTSTVTQEIRFGAIGFYYFYPAISIDTFGSLGVIFGFSSQNNFPSLAVTGQPFTNPINTIENPIAIKSGTGTNTSTRHGDYFGAALDPSDLTRIWVAGQYHASPWSTWIDSFSVSDTTPIIVGGEGIPINTTALLIAGFNANSIWMIPTVLGLAGAGIAVYNLKRK